MRYFHLGGVLLFMVALSFNGIFREWEESFKNYFLQVFRTSRYFNFLRSFQINVFLTNFFQIPLNRYERVRPFME